VSPAAPESIPHQEAVQGEASSSGFSTSAEMSMTEKAVRWMRGGMQAAGLPSELP
jgi:hypothetical protein